HAENNAEKQRSIFADGDHWLKLPAEVHQEAQRLRVDDFVAEVASADEESDGRNHKRDYIALLVAIQAGRDEHPDLVKNEGRGHEEPSHGCNLQVKVEGFGGIQINQLLGHAVGAEYVHDRPLHDVIDVFHLPPAGEETDGHGCD